MIFRAEKTENIVIDLFIGIKIAPDANLLEVTDRIREFFPKIISALPHGLTAEIVYDSTKYIHSSIYEVSKTLAEALLIVTVVIFLFLGNLHLKPPLQVSHYAILQGRFF